MALLTGLGALLDFREHALAAPLKRFEVLEESLRRARFPRARARGPIEALERAFDIRLDGEFPRARARGPIEARNFGS